MVQVLKSLTFSSVVVEVEVEVVGIDVYEMRKKEMMVK